MIKKYGFMHKSRGDASSEKIHNESVEFSKFEMDGIIKENGSSGVDQLTSSTHNAIKISSVQSVIQATQQSVIQTTTGSFQPSVLTKGNVILVSKPNSVIQTPQGSLQTLQVVVENPGTDDEDSLSPRVLGTKKRRNILGTSPPRIKLENSYTNDMCTKMESSGSDDCDSNLDSELSSHSLSMSNHYQTVLPSTETLQLSSQHDDVQGLSSITMTTAGNTSTGTILHYAGQDGQFFVPGDIVVMPNTGNDNMTNAILSPEDQVKKRELRLLKNREAARECRRKKKEYIKCLENRVAVLETQNKALIDELKSLKELYCSQKLD